MLILWPRGLTFNMQCTFMFDFNEILCVKKKKENKPLRGFRWQEKKKKKTLFCVGSQRDAKKIFSGAS